MVPHHSSRPKFWTVLLAAFLSLAMAGCAHELSGSEKTSAATAAPDSASPAHAETSASWTYPAMSRTTNNWVKDGYRECGPEVAMQSPTLLDPATANTNTGWSLPTNLSSATYTVPLARIESHNNYDFKVDPSGVRPLTIQWRGATWRFFEFHFHVPAEHAVVGQTLAVMEMHVKASNVDNPGDVVVFAVPFVVDSHPYSVPLLAPVAAAMAGQSGQTFSLGPLLAAFTSNPTFIYMGGLTTPPCGGDKVRFYVLQYPLAVDLASWQSIAASLTNLNKGVNNVRPLQPRPVTTPSSIALVKS